MPTGEAHARGVGDQPVGRIHGLQEVAERATLQTIEQRFAAWHSVHRNLRRDFDGVLESQQRRVHGLPIGEIRGVRRTGDHHAVAG